MNFMFPCFLTLQQKATGWKKAAPQERPDEKELSLTESLIQQTICAGRFPVDNPSDTNTLQHSTCNPDIRGLVTACGMPGYNSTKAL